MSEELLPDFYRIEVPLRGNPLKSVNSYVIRARDRSLIIDTALNRGDCREVLSRELAELGVNPATANYFLTHRHGDHRGLMASLAGTASKVYLGRAELEFIRVFGYGDRRIHDMAVSNGFPRPEVERAFRSLPGRSARSSVRLEYQALSEGDHLTIGNYRFRCLETPGHSQGHLCLYEPEKKLFVAGDHILGDVTPNISAWFNDVSPLHQYLASLDKVFPLEVGLVLPGHRRPFKNFRERIRELKRHHRRRTEEVLAILGEGESQHAYRVASRMKWDLTYQSWEQFSPVQKWFATGEALSHLRFLEKEGRVSRETGAGPVRYSLT